LSKRKLPKKPVFSYCPGLPTRKEEFYTPKDIALGNYINIFGRDAIITDCDDFTKKWFKQK
jgi:hypothetical protein